MKKIDFKFDLCIDTAVLIDFVHSNTAWGWNDLCQIEYQYRHEDWCDNPAAYPLVELGETDDSKFQYWVERFLEVYKEEIGDKSVYIVSQE